MADTQQTPNADHYDECPVHTGGGPACRCDAITAEDDAYYAEPANMAALESGGGVPIW